MIQNNVTSTYSKYIVLIIMLALLVIGRAVHAEDCWDKKIACETGCSTQLTNDVNVCPEGETLTACVHWALVNRKSCMDNCVDAFLRCRNGGLANSQTGGG